VVSFRILIIRDEIFINIKLDLNCKIRFCLCMHVSSMNTTVVNFIPTFSSLIHCTGTSYKSEYEA
jgi:hypothetical protein